MELEANTRCVVRRHEEEEWRKRGKGREESRVERVEGREGREGRAFNMV